MLVANIVVETLPGKAEAVAERLARLRGMGALAHTGDDRLTAIWKVPDCDNVEGLSEVLQAMNPEIVHVYPAFVGEED
jgi:hypothetical protein